MDLDLSYISNTSSEVYADFPKRIPNILIWKSYPTTSFPHSGWTESKINKSDTRLVIFVSKFFKRQKLKRIFFFFFFKQFLIVEAELSCVHACNIPYVFSETKKNAKYLFQSWENLISKWHVCYSDWTRPRNCFFILVKRWGKSDKFSCIL